MRASLKLCGSLIQDRVKDGDDAEVDLARKLEGRCNSMEQLSDKQ